MKKITSSFCLVILLVSLNFYGQLTNGLKAHYSFAGSAADMSGQNNNGIIQGSLLLTSDRFGSSNCAYEFPGTSTDFINVNYSNDFNIPSTGAFSISLWFQGGTPNIGDFEILFQKENPMVNPHHSDYHLGLYDGNNPSFGSLYSPIVMASTSHPNPDPNWHHVVAIYDNKKWFIYQDNVLIESNITQTYGIYQSTNNITIGKYFMGKLDDIRFYDRVLTVSEITQLYNFGSDCQSLTIDEPSLTEHFTVYPNPATSVLHLKGTPNNAVAYMIDLAGRIVLKKEITSEEENIDISSLNEGTYLITIVADKQSKTKLVIKQ